MLATLPRTRGDTGGDVPKVSTDSVTVGAAGGKTGFSAGSTFFDLTRSSFGSGLGNPLKPSGGLPITSEAEDWCGTWTPDGASDGTTADAEAILAGV